MLAQSRREFLQKSIAAAVAGLTAQSAVPRADPFAGGVLIGTRPLFGAGAPVHPLETPLGAGLDARLLTDLSTLTPETLVVPNERFTFARRIPTYSNHRAPGHSASQASCAGR